MALKDQGQLDEAVASCRLALELKPDYADAHSNLGIAMHEQGKLDEAVACYRRALQLKPDFADAHGDLGSVLVEQGDLQGAEECFRTALRHDSRSAFARFKLAELLGAKLPEQDLLDQRRLLEGPASGEQTELTDAKRLLLHFGLAEALDARGEYAEAARHLDRANALQLVQWRNRGKQYDPQEHELFVDRLIAVCTPDFFTRLGGLASESEVPVFVFGLPRSGTTLIEQVLAGHSQVFAAGEIPLAAETFAVVGQAFQSDPAGPAFLPNQPNHPNQPGHTDPSLNALRHLDCQTARRLASLHLEKLRVLRPAALRIVDKMPDNYLLLGLLAVLFPRAKFIHCRRDLRDVAVSCWISHFRSIRWANTGSTLLRDFGSTAGSWSTGGRSCRSPLGRGL